MLAASMAAVAGGAALSTSALSSATPPQAPPPMPANALITLGVQAGPPPVPNRTGISTALKIGGDVYQIDCGLGSLNAFTNAGFRFDDLKSIFITHLHTDHMVDYFSFLQPLVADHVVGLQPGGHDVARTSGVPGEMLFEGDQ
jgi:L-ascorbate metabolism protein UlaG (beta-lactamase superfamily)